MISLIQNHIRNNILIIIAIILLDSCGHKENIFKMKNFSKVDNNLYVYNKEVSNKEYNLFLKWAEENHSDSIEYYRIKNTNWETFNNGYFKEFGLFYSTHPKYSDYPVVNISFVGAKMFCKWLSDEFNKNDKHFIYNFKIPTEREWLLSIGYIDVPINEVFYWGSISIYNQKGKLMSNLLVPDYYKVIDSYEIILPSKAFSKNKYGLFNMYGNVAEMIDEDGRAKGGGWYNLPKESLPSKIQNYKESSPYVGFRPFLIIR